MIASHGSPVRDAINPRDDRWAANLPTGLHAHWIAALGLLLAVAGHAAYHQPPLAQHVRVAPTLNTLDTQVPTTSHTDPPTNIDAAGAVSTSAIGLLAVLNDPDLDSVWGLMRLASPSRTSLK